MLAVLISKIARFDYPKEWYASSSISILVIRILLYCTYCLVIIPCPSFGIKPNVTSDNWILYILNPNEPGVLRI